MSAVNKDSLLFFFSCRSCKSETTETNNRCQGRRKGYVVVISAAEDVVVTVVVNASDVVRFVAAATMLPLSVISLDVMSVVTKVIMRGTVKIVGVSSVMSPAINVSNASIETDFLLACGLIPLGLAGVGRGMTRRPLLCGVSGLNLLCLQWLRGDNLVVVVVVRCIILLCGFR